MNSRRALSIAPYYGGKARMAHFIADRLNYKDTEVFVTPFGGMCRELLNKPRHKVEIYNDYSSALCALMQVLSDPEKSSKFIRRLYYETEFSQAEFDKQKAIFDNAEVDLEEQEKEKLRQLLIANKVINAHISNRLMDEILLRVYENDTERKLTPAVEAGIVKLKQLMNSDDKFVANFQGLLGNWVELHQLKEQGAIPRPFDMGEYVSEMDLAVATYVVYMQSRNGSGEYWSKEKFKTTDDYLRSVLRLYECAERLRGVSVLQLDALDFFRSWRPDGAFSPRGGNPPTNFVYFNEWINNPLVMMYCDPSYISVESEKQNNPKNLGKPYARSFEYDEQEQFLRCIQNAKCKMMVSNYDLQLYNKYLNESTGWRREEFITTATAGGKIASSRVEVIWYNY